MKKLAIGCGIVLLVVGIAGAGIVYWGYTKVKSTVAQLAELGQVADIEKGVNNKSAFVPPDSRELTASQVDKLVQIQARVRQHLGASGAAIERNYKSLMDKKEATVTDLPALLGAYKDMAKALIDAKRAQVEALNEAGLSLDEYRWIRTESYRALGVPFVDLDFSRISERTRQGQTAGTLQLNGAVGDKGPESNVKLVEKYRKALEDYMALASFGL
jgi:hypothetical protein